MRVIRCNIFFYKLILKKMFLKNDARNVCDARVCDIIYKLLFITLCSIKKDQVHRYPTFSILKNTCLLINIQSIRRNRNFLILFILLPRVYRFEK